MRTTQLVSQTGIEGLSQGTNASWVFSFEDALRRPDQLNCGLRISDSPPSDNLTPQESTIQETGNVGADGASLSCPGSKVEADSGDHDNEL